MYCSVISLLDFRPRLIFLAGYATIARMSTVLRNRGMLIVFEGLDKTGKTTHTKNLAEFLRSDGHLVEQFRFPNRGTIIGKIISDYLTNEKDLSDQTVHLLFSANRWEFSSKITKLLNVGTTIIIDRYAYSGVAYSSAKGLDLHWCKAPDVGLPRPDLVFYLDIDSKSASQRGDWGKERYETDSFQEKVRHSYKKLMEDNWKVIDASRTIADIGREIISVTKTYLSKEPLGEIHCLWANIISSKESESNDMNEYC